MLSKKQEYLFFCINALQKLDVFPLSIIPHLGLFLTEKKSACRFILKSQCAKEILNLSNQFSIYGIISPIQSQALNEHWSTFEPLNSDSEESMIVLSRIKNTAELITKYELNGSSSLVGKLLGYPECCVSHYSTLSSNNAGWVKDYLKHELSTSMVSKWCNRLASTWGGTCPTGELFPCSLLCERAIEMGKTSDKCLRFLGLDNLADEILRQATTPIYFENGVIIKGHKLTESVTKIEITD